MILICKVKRSAGCPALAYASEVVMDYNAHSIILAVQLKRRQFKKKDLAQWVREAPGLDRN